MNERKAKTKHCPAHDDYCVGEGCMWWDADMEEEKIGNCIIREIYEAVKGMRKNFA